jgi:hypothetical protein
MCSVNAFDMKTGLLQDTILAFTKKDQNITPCRVMTATSSARSEELQITE